MKANMEKPNVSRRASVTRKAIGAARSKPSLPKRSAGAAEEALIREQVSVSAAEWQRQGAYRCRVCSCHEMEPCNPPCGWQPGQVNLCTTCATMALRVIEWLEQAHQPSQVALLREVKRLQADGGEYLRTRRNPLQRGFAHR